MPNGEPSYIWLPTLRRYRDTKTGRFVSRADVLTWSQRSISESADHARGLAGALAADDVTLGRWQRDMRDQIKGEYIRQYLLGRGGRAQMTAADWGSIGGMCGHQYRFLDGFAADIAAGKLSEKQIAARAGLYFHSARQSFERAWARASRGLEEVRWNLTAAEHCPDCLDFAGLGWQKVADDPFEGAYPGSGDTQCGANCRCYLSYR